MLRLFHHPTSLSTVLLRLLLTLVTPTAVFAQDPAPEDWIQLFNGRDLQGWQVKIAGRELGDNYRDTFRVRNGVLQVGYDGYESFDGAFGHIFYDRPFSYYRLRVEYRFLGEQVPGAPDWAFRNSGVMVHSQSGESMREDQDFPICIEVQLLGGDGTHQRSTANLCTPGTHVEMDGELETRHCVNSRSRTYHGDQWVTVEIEVLGSDQIRHLVEGETVLAYERPQIGGGAVNHFDPTVKDDGKLLDSGYIALQSESHPVEFRKVELLQLIGCTDPEADNYKSYFVKSDNTRCRY